VTEETDDMSHLPMLSAGDFEGTRLKRPGKALVFFYARWCPFSRAACEETGCIRNKGDYVAYSTELSEDDNPLWEDLGIDIVPALIGYEDGEEVYRKQGRRMMGLRKADFESADEAMS
jgi:thioredoxin 1